MKVYIFKNIENNIEVPFKFVDISLKVLRISDLVFINSSLVSFFSSSILSRVSSCLLTACNKNPIKNISNFRNAGKRVGQTK